MCNERDILGMQLIKRNDELSQLYEKIKIQQTTLNAGERAYAERVADIAALQMDLATLKAEGHMLKASVANMDMLRHEGLQLERELLQERTKVRALAPTPTPNPKPGPNQARVPASSSSTSPTP